MTRKSRQSPVRLLLRLTVHARVVISSGIQRGEPDSAACVRRGRDLWSRARTPNKRVEVRQRRLASQSPRRVDRSLSGKGHQRRAIMMADGRKSHAPLFLTNILPTMRTVFGTLVPSRYDGQAADAQGSTFEVVENTVDGHCSYTAI